MVLSLVAVLVFIINIPFGYWRSKSRRFSLQWLLAIHIPVAIAIVLRLLLLDWNWAVTPIFIAAFMVGQYTGGKLRKTIWYRREQMRLALALVKNKESM